MTKRVLPCLCLCLALACSEPEPLDPRTRAVVSLQMVGTAAARGMSERDRDLLLLGAEQSVREVPEGAEKETMREALRAYREKDYERASGLVKKLESRR